LEFRILPYAQHERIEARRGNPGEVIHRLELDAPVERGRHRVGAVGEQQRVAIGRRARHQLGGDRAGLARLALHHDGLSETFRHFLRQQARNDVDIAAGRKTHHQPQRPVRIGLRECNARSDGQAKNKGNDAQDHDGLHRALNAGSQSS
jgi:hypothetical protein